MKGKFLFVILAGTVLYAQLGSAWDAKNIKPKTDDDLKRTLTNINIKSLKSLELRGRSKMSIGTIKKKVFT